MRYKLLGKSGLRVSELCLGTMTFGEEFGWGSNKDESRAVFNAYAEAGGNFLDTADRYTNGTSEQWVGEFVGSERDRFVIATKYSLVRRPGDPNGSGNHRKSFFDALHQSLKRLNTDYIDLYWLHAWDYLTPVEEIMRAFDDAVRAGKIHYAGISDAPAWEVSRANTLAELRGWTRFVGLQIEYSLIERTPERELLPMAREMEIGFTAWSPLASGLLTGKYAPGAGTGEERRLDRAQFLDVNERNLAIAAAVGDVAREVGRSPAQVALAWIRQQGHALGNEIILILGARKLGQFQDNLGCLSLTLSEDQMRRLNDVSHIALGFPHDFLARDNIRQLVYGGTWDRIDRRR